jgi:hypothetical protein
VTLDSTSFKTARRGDLVDDFGIDDELPSNPYIFTLEAGSHPKYLGAILVHSPDGNPIPGNRQLIHNSRGVFHQVKVSTTGSLRLGPRRQDIEAHNIQPPDRWVTPLTPVYPLDAVIQPVVDNEETQPIADNADEIPLPYISTPTMSDTSSSTTNSPVDDTTVRLHPIPDYL